MERVHAGFINIGENREDVPVLYLTEDKIEKSDEPLAEQLSYLHGKFATVRYYVSDQAMTQENAEKLFIESLFGALYGEVEADYRIRYSEHTGYLWTDEILNVGGHDLIEEFKTHLNKYLILLIDVNEGG